MSKKIKECPSCMMPAKQNELKKHGGVCSVCADEEDPIHQCPDCMKDVDPEELQIFGGLCEECSEFINS